MHKGQIFSTDFLFAMILIILGFGVLTSLGEFNLYNTKQKAEFSLLKEKTQTGIITLANSPNLTCDANTISLAYSIDINKLSELTKTNSKNLKNIIALPDNNITLSITSALSGTPQYYVNEETNYENIVLIDVNVLLCNKDLNYYDLNVCMTTTNCVRPSLWKGTLTLKVGE